ncbi:MAG TPA: hypothetical protein VFN67_35365 [Polyangiales bacterium]|nr:hypothetical protein [Polyangiales bacterium]
METDDSKRNRSGVVCTLVLDGAGRARLVMDDAKSPTDKAPQSWVGKTLFTWMDFTEEAFLPGDLSDAELREIGFALVLRLGAFEKTKRAKDP